MSQQHNEFHTYLKAQFGKGPFSRQSAEILAARCGQVSEIVDEMIQDGHIEDFGRGLLALAGDHAEVRMPAVV